MASLLLLVSSAHGQAPDTLWTRMYGGPGNDYGYCLDITSDGGFIVAGSYFRQEANSDFYLLRTDDQGDTLWTRTYGGDHYDGARWVFQTLDDGYIVAGIDRSYNFGENDVQVFKTDSLGSILWARSYGGDQEDGVVAGQRIEDGGFILAGYTASFGNGSMDAWLLRLNADGDTLWTRTYGGENYDFGTSVIQTPDDGYFIVCNINYGFDDQGLTLIKTDAEGDSLWARRYFDNNEFGASVISAGDNEYLILANTLALSDEFDIRLIRIDADGDTLWTNIIGDLEIDMANSIQQTIDGGFIICGITGPYFDQDIYVLRTDPEGDTLWTKMICGRQYGNDVGNCIRQTSDGGFVLTGSLSTEDTGQEVCLIKLASDQVDIENELDEGPYHGFNFFSNYPNPFNGTTVIRYALPEPDRVKIEIFDILGRRVEALIDERRLAGYHEAVWDARNRRSGIYFFRIQAGDRSMRSKMLLLK
jgi:hypothetical protein